MLLPCEYQGCCWWSCREDCISFIKKSVTVVSSSSSFLNLMQLPTFICSGGIVKDNCTPFVWLWLITMVRSVMNCASRVLLWGFSLQPLSFPFASVPQVLENTSYHTVVRFLSYLCLGVRRMVYNIEICLNFCIFMRLVYSTVNDVNFVLLLTSPKYLHIISCNRSCYIKTRSQKS